MRPSDEELVRATLAGDATAFLDLYNAYAPLVRAICADTTGNLNEAQDLAQEVFLRVHRKLPELHNPKSFGAWLVGFSRRVCKEWRRSRARDRHQYIGFDLEQAATNTEPIADDSLDRVRLALASLPEQERLAVHVFYLQQVPADQASSLLGLSRSGFYRLLERARKRLGSLLQKSLGGIP